MTLPTPRGIILYRSILRAHKKYLPTEMKQLGDTYVRSEFRAHRDAKPEHLTGFFQEWENYLSQLTVTARARDSLASGGAMQDGAAASGARTGGSEVFAFGADLPTDIELSEEQIQQLEKLREETEKFGQS